MRNGVKVFTIVRHRRPLSTSRFIDLYVAFHHKKATDRQITVAIRGFDANKRSGY